MEFSSPAEITHPPDQNNQDTIDEYLRSITVEEPIREDLKALVRADLNKIWHYDRESAFRELLRREWSTLDSEEMTLSDPVGNVTPLKSRYLFNKPTAFYWLQSAQPIDAYGNRTQTPRILLAAIYEEWTRSHGKVKPNIEFGHFFATPVRVTSTGPETVSGLIEAHLSLCAQASTLASLTGVNGRGGESIYPWMASQSYKLFPLFQSIIVIIDDFQRIEPESDGMVSLRKFAQHRTVLVARTHSEEGLHHTISLSKLRSQCPPLNRPDVDEREVDIVRVSFAAAVQSITDLEMQERYVSPWCPSEDFKLDGSICPSVPRGYFRLLARNPTTWADTCIFAAEKHGYDSIDTSYSIRRVLAGLKGIDCPLEQEPFGRWWKRD
ncbi:MAG: hypothetical protein Q9160_008666 [Pyrenula sp. 1 TL-2023]